jgi:hypothetical protein
MIDAMECHDYAHLCGDLANRCAVDSPMRSVLFEMASAWRQAAIEFENINTQELRTVRLVSAQTWPALDGETARVRGARD